MSQTRPRIAIIGGGIGGLFAANAMIAQGLDVSVYEQAPELGEIGAGFFVTPNSVRHLQRVGLGPAVEKWGALVGEGSQYLRDDGTIIAPVQVTDAAGWNATYGMHRADFVDLLAAALPADVIHCSHKGIKFEQSDEQARVTFTQRRPDRRRCRYRRRWHSFRTPAQRLSAINPRVPRHHQLPWPGVP